MAKIYKVSLYITDYNEEYKDGEHLKSELTDCIYDELWAGVDQFEVEESEKFEWDDDLAINKINAKKEDFEAYFIKRN